MSYAAQGATQLLDAALAAGRRPIAEVTVELLLSGDTKEFRNEVVSRLDKLDPAQSISEHCVGLPPCVRETNGPELASLARTSINRPTP